MRGPFLYFYWTFLIVNIISNNLNLIIYNSHLFIYIFFYIDTTFFLVFLAHVNTYLVVIYFNNKSAVYVYAGDPFKYFSVRKQEMEEIPRYDQFLMCFICFAFSRKKGRGCITNVRHRWRNILCHLWLMCALVFDWNYYA